GTDHAKPASKCCLLWRSLRSMAKPFACCGVGPRGQAVAATRLRDRLPAVFAPRAFRVGLAADDRLRVALFVAVPARPPAEAPAERVRGRPRLGVRVF